MTAQRSKRARRPRRIEYTPRERIQMRGFCTGPEDGAPGALDEVGADYMATCCTCGRRVRVTARGRYAHHKPAEPPPAPPNAEQQRLIDAWHQIIGSTRTAMATGGGLAPPLTSTPAPAPLSVRTPASGLITPAEVERHDLAPWIVVARIADYARRRGAKISVHKTGINPTIVSHVWHIAVQEVDKSIDFISPLTLSEEHELCEMLGSRILEHAVEVNRLAATEGAVVDQWYQRALARRCPACIATVGRPCVPTHDGERDTGTWLHPERYRENAADAMTRAIAWAFSADADKMVRDLPAGVLAAVIRRLSRLALLDDPKRLLGQGRVTP